VSAFGEGGVGDDGDHWSVICTTKYWNRDDKVRFKHALTKKYVTVVYIHAATLNTVN
jgi:hypothetical protein